MRNVRWRTTIVTPLEQHALLSFEHELVLEERRVCSVGHTFGQRIVVEVEDR